MKRDNLQNDEWNGTAFVLLSRIRRNLFFLDVLNYISAPLYFRFTDVRFLNCYYGDIFPEIVKMLFMSSGSGQ